MITTGGIYGIKNYGDDNFYYIGKTKNNFYIRWGQHITGIQKGLTTKPGLYWYEFEKGNIDRIDFTILYDCRRSPLESDKDLLELEKKFIQEYQPKYNISGRSKEYNEEKRERLIRKIVKEFSGKPLRGEIQKDFIQRFIDYNIRDNSRRKVETFTRACNIIREVGIKIEERQANQKDLKKWENILTKIREKYKIIMLDENI